MRTTLIVWLATFGIVVSGSSWNIPVVVWDEQPPAPYHKVVGLTCHWNSDKADHILADYCDGSEPHIALFSQLIDSPQKAMNVAYHERLHYLLPHLSEKQAWDRACYRYWVEEWCGAGAYRGGTQ